MDAVRNVRRMDVVRRKAAMTDAGEKLRDRMRSERKKSAYFNDGTMISGGVIDDYCTDRVRDELERAAEIADRFKQPWVGEEIRKLKE